MKIQEALSAFYEANQFGDDGGESSNWAWLKMGPITIPMYNPESRKQVLFLHDIHHLITGYGTDWRGESSVSAWEIATGGWGNRIYIWLIIFGAFIVGLFRFPRLSMEAFARGLRTKGLIQMNLPKQELLKSTIEELQIKTLLNQTKIEKISTAEKIEFFKWATIAIISWLLIFGLMGAVVFYLFKTIL